MSTAEAPKPAAFYDTLLSLLRFVHQVDDVGISLKDTELDPDIAVKVAPTIDDIQVHPNKLNVAHFELIPTDEIASEDELVKYMTKSSNVWMLWNHRFMI